MFLIGWFCLPRDADVTSRCETQLTMAGSITPFSSRQRVVFVGLLRTKVFANTLFAHDVHKDCSYIKNWLKRGTEMNTTQLAGTEGGIDMDTLAT